MQSDTPPSLTERATAFARSYWTPAGKRAVGNLVGLLVCQAIGLGCQLVNLVVLTHSISPSDYGKYILAMSLFPYLYVLGTIAGGVIAVREIRRDPERFSAILASHLRLSAPLATAVAGVTIAIAWLAPLESDRFVITAIALASIVSSLGISFAFDAEHRPALAAAAIAVSDIALAATTVTLASLGVMSLALAACLVPARWIVLVSLQWILQVGVLRRGPSRPSREIMRTLLVGSAPPVLVALVWNANAALAVILVRSLYGDQETAFYGVAVLIATVVNSTVDMAFRIVGPHILGPHGLQLHFVVKLACFLAAFLPAVALGAFAAAALLSRFLLPPEYNRMLDPLAWLLAGGVARGAWEAAASYLLRFDRQVLSLVSMALTCLASSAFGYLAAGQLGITSFAIGTCFAFIIAAAIHVWLAWRFWPHQ